MRPGQWRRLWNRTSLANLIVGQFLLAGTTGLGKFSTAVTAINGAITITGNGQAAGCVVTLTPTASSGAASLSWAIASVTHGCRRNRIGTST